MDDNLSDNVVDIVLNHHIIPSTVTSCDADDVVIVTFATTVQLYWIKLPHPQTMVTKVMQCSISYRVSIIL